MADEAFAAADAAQGDGLARRRPDRGQGGHPGRRTAHHPRLPLVRPAEAEDAEVVRRLRAAGAIPIGITNVPELTIFPWTASDATGITRNPWNPERTPAAPPADRPPRWPPGWSRARPGSDGGGSIRIPAACCGLVGMKPTRGPRLEMPAGEHWLGLSTYGPLARTVADSALMLDVMHGTIEGDVHRARAFEGSYRDAAAPRPGACGSPSPGRSRSGLIAPIVGRPARRVGADAGRAGESLGHEVVERAPAYGMVAIEFTQNWLRGIYEDSLQVPDASQLERTTRRGWPPPAGCSSRSGRARKLREQRARTTARVLGLWDDVDVLLTPGLAHHADRRGGRLRRRGVRGLQQGRAVHPVDAVRQRHRSAGGHDPRGDRRGRASVERPAGGSDWSRGHALLARGPAGAGRAVGRHASAARARGAARAGELVGIHLIVRGALRA